MNEPRRAAASASPAGAQAAAAGAAAPLNQPEAAAAATEAALVPPRTPARRRLSLREKVAGLQQHAGSLPAPHPPQRSAPYSGGDEGGDEPSQQRTGSSRPTAQSQTAQPSPYTGEYEFSGEDEAAPFGYTGTYAFHEQEGESDGSVDLTGTPARSKRPHSKRRPVGPAAPAVGGGWTEDGWFVPPPTTSTRPGHKRHTSTHSNLPPLTRFLSPSKPASS